MTALEKIGSPPTRLGGTALYDWDYLVQEDRAHRLIYTDPAIFEAEMTHIFGGTWTYLAHESEIPHDQRLHHAAHGLASAHHRARQPRDKSARSTTAAPIAARPCAAGTRAIANRSNARITAGIFSTPANCAACRGRKAMPPTCAIQNTILPRCHASNLIAASSSARSISMRCRSPSISAPISTSHRRVARPQSRRQGRGLRGEPLQIQGQLEARLRQFLRRLSRRLFASFAAGNRESLCRRECQRHGVLPQLARHPADVHALHRPRQSLQGQAAEPGKAAGRACGRWRARIPAWSTTRPNSSNATATAPSRSSISPAPSRSTSTSFRTSRCSATISRCSSRSASRRPTPSGTAP